MRVKCLRSHFSMLRPICWAVVGRAADVAAFISGVEERMHSYVRQTERTAGTRAPRFSGFTIQ